MANGKNVFYYAIKGAGWFFRNLPMLAGGALRWSGYLAVGLTALVSAPVLSMAISSVLALGLLVVDLVALILWWAPRVAKKFRLGAMGWLTLASAWVAFTLVAEPLLVLATAYGLLFLLVSLIKALFLAKKDGMTDWLQGHGVIEGE